MPCSHTNHILITHNSNLKTSVLFLWLPVALILVVATTFLVVSPNSLPASLSSVEKSVERAYVTWIDTNNVVTGPRSLLLSNASDGASAGARSVQTFSNDGDVSLAFTPVGQGRVIVGLMEDGATSDRAEDAAYSIVIQNGRAEARRAGQILARAQASRSDRFTIALERSKGRIVYRKNGRVFSLIQEDAKRVFFVRAFIASRRSGLSNVTLSPRLTATATIPPHSTIPLRTSTSSTPAADTPLPSLHPSPATIVSSYSVSVPSSVVTGARVSVTWQAPTTTVPKDWIGLYRVGGGDRDYLWWMYTNAQSTGDVDVPIPEEPGPFEMRFYLDDGYVLAASSQAFTVAGSPIPSTIPSISAPIWLPPPPSAPSPVPSPPLSAPPILFVPTPFPTIAPPPSPSPVALSPSTIFEFTDYLDRNWSNELVLYDVPADVYGKDTYILSGPNGNIPYQWANGNQIAFLATVAPFDRSVYRLVAGVPSLSTDMIVSQESGIIEVRNSKTGIRVRTDISALTQGPIAGVRLGSGTWVGSGTVAGVSGPYSARVVASGPVYTDVEATYGSGWTITFRIIAGEPVVLVDETFSGNSGARYDFSLNTNFNADQVYMRTNYSETSSRNINSATDDNAFLLTPWFYWWEEGYQGTWALFHRSSGSDTLGVAARDAGIWVDGARTTWEHRVPISKDTLTMRLQLQGFERKWMLYALDKNAATTDPPDGPLDPESSVNTQDDVSLAQQYAIKYGDWPLDKVKEYVFDWPDGGEVFPHLFAGPADISMLKSYYQITNLDWYRGAGRALSVYELDEIAATMHAADDPELDRKVAGVAQAWLQYAVNNYVRQNWYRTAGHDLSRHYNDNAPALNLIDAVLSRGVYTPAEEKIIRAQVAFLGYALSDPLVLSPERGYGANPNMTSATRSALAVAASLFPNHPAARGWANTAESEFAHELTDWTGPQGGFMEAPHYAAVSLDALIAGTLALYRAGLASGDWVHSDQMKNALRWIAGISTPQDPQLSNQRHLPAIGNTMTGERTRLPGLAASLWKDLDPAFSKEMQWAWNQQGTFTSSGIGGFYPGIIGSGYLLLNPNLPAQAPAWSSEEFPGNGAVFRAHFPGPQETYLHYLQGKLRTHYDYDAGSFILWAQGKPLVEDFGYTGRGEASDHNRVDDGDDVSENADPMLTGPYGDYIHGNMSGWHRQILFAKDTVPTGANYAVIRDAMTHGKSGDWRTWIMTDSTPVGLAGSVVRAIGRFGVDLSLFVAEQPGTLSSQTLTRDSIASGYNGGNAGPYPLTQRSVQFTIPGGKQSAVVLYPVARGTSTPTFAAFAGGKGVKIVHEQGTDYVFLSLGSSSGSMENVSFSNTEGGIIQIRGSATQVTVFGSGSVTYNGTTVTGVAGKATTMRF